MHELSLDVKLFGCLAFNIRYQL